MPWIVFTEEADSSFGHLGEAIWFRPDEDEGTEIPQPSDIQILAVKGSGVLYGGRLYVVNQYTDNILIDEHMRMHRMGIDAPTGVPVLSSGGGGPISGLVGTHIGYVSYLDSITGERSSLSAGSVGFDNAGANIIAWAGVPTTCPNPRVDYVELWRSVDGGAIRYVGRRSLGATGITEQIPTLSLGEVAPNFFERFPPGIAVAMYHDRLALAGDEEAPDTLYLSALFFPERYEGLSFKTRNGEPIVGLINVRDMLLVLCPTSSYILQGYSEDDMVFSLSEPDLGALNHNCLALAHGNAIIANTKSIYLFNGSWHNILRTGMEEYRRLYEITPSDFHDAFGIFDPVRDVYKLTLSGGVTIPPLLRDIPYIFNTSPSTFSWVADMRPVTPELSGSFVEPNWSFDIRMRTDWCNAVLRVPGWTDPRLVTGSEDGFIRRENVMENDEDEGDTLGKPFVVSVPAYLLDDPGGAAEDGKTLLRLWTYVKSELTDWKLLVVGGDEDLHEAFRIEPLFDQYFEDNISASLLAVTMDVGGDMKDVVYTPKTVHVHPIDTISGRAFTAQVVVAGAVDVVFRGLGFTYGPGPITRPPRSIEDPPG